jgi:hypothetical protein
MSETGKTGNRGTEIRVRQGILAHNLWQVVSIIYKANETIKDIQKIFCLRAMI